MKRTLLPTLAGVLAAVVISASGFALPAAAQTDQQPAQPAVPPTAQPTHAEKVQHWAEAALDTQLKNMKTSLRLAADQETLWGPFESAVRDGAKARVIALQKEQGGKLSPMDRNLAKADRLAQSQTSLESMIEAAKPLYASLDETQKHKFITQGRMLVPERGQFVKEMRHLQ